MKTRRGSDYWGNGDEGMITQFEAGDIVRPTGVSDFIGVVRDVQPRINKVSVAWGAGTVSQHDPDEVQLVPYAYEITKSKMASEEVVLETRRGAKISSDFFVGADEPEQYVGNPRTHGLDTPRGGGFSIMQNLQKDLAPEALAESKKGPKVAPEGSDEADTEGGDQNAPDGDPNKAPEAPAEAKMAALKNEYGDTAEDIAMDVVSRMQSSRRMKMDDAYKDIGYWDLYNETRAHELPRDFWSLQDTDEMVKALIKPIEKAMKRLMKKQQKAASMKSRRAMYWMDKGRTYRLTKQEQGEGCALCPRCKKDMEKSPFTKSEKLYMCPECGFKVPSSKVLTERKVEVEIAPDGSVEVEVEPVEQEKEAALVSRRGR